MISETITITKISAKLGYKPKKDDVLTDSAYLGVTDGMELWEEVPDPDFSGEGTAESPFILVVGMALTQNAYYSYNDKRYVYMGSASVATEDILPTDDEDMNFSNGWAEF